MEHQTIEQVVQNMPLQNRMVYVLSEIIKIQTSDIAKILEISKSKIKLQIMEAKSFISKELKQQKINHDLYEFNAIYCDKMVKNVMQKVKNK